MGLSNPVTLQMIGGVIRSLLIAAGAGSALSGDQLTAGAGALAVLIGIAWSMASKRLAADTQHAAVVKAVAAVAADPSTAHEVIAASRAGTL
jgi:hypothetical protein